MMVLYPEISPVGAHGRISSDKASCDMMKAFADLSPFLTREEHHDFWKEVGGPKQKITK